MYDMFSKVPSAFAKLKKQLSDYIIDQGDNLVKDLKLKPDEFVTSIIGLRERLFNIYV